MRHTHERNPHGRGEDLKKVLVGFSSLQLTCSVQTTAIKRVGGDFYRKNLSDQYRTMNNRVIRKLVRVGGVRNQEGLHQKDRHAGFDFFLFERLFLEPCQLSKQGGGGHPEHPPVQKFLNFRRFLRKFWKNCTLAPFLDTLPALLDHRSAPEPSGKDCYCQLHIYFLLLCCNLPSSMLKLK